MRIFYAADNTPNARIPTSRLWYDNLYRPLVDLGHDVVMFDYDLSEHQKNLDPASKRQAAFIQANRPKLEQALVDQVRRAHKEGGIDLFFSYFYSAMCTAEIIEEIKALGIPTMNWYCNASYQFHLVSDLAPAYDWSLVPELFRLQDYRDAGANPVYMQEAANPNVYKPVDTPQLYDCTFCGMRYGDRPDFVQRLVDSGVPTHVWGPGWLEHADKEKGLWRRLTGRAPGPDAARPVCGPALSDEDLVALYSKSRISLGFSSCGDTHETERILQVRLRDFEAPMSGAFYMVEAMDELTRFFEPGKEIVFYEDADDLAEKARWYLDHPAEREAIRKAGHARAQAEHTWHQRFRKVFADVGLTP